MSVDAQRTLRSAIANRTFDAVYYLHGADDFRKDLAVAELSAAATDPATREFNLETLRANETDAARMSTALYALPMLAERRVVVVRDVASLKKPARAVLDAYLAKPSPDSVVVLISHGDQAPDAELARAATTVEFSMPTEREVIAWLTQRARKNGVEITSDAAELLAAAVEGDLGQAAGELDKLTSYVRQGTIDAAAVEAIVGIRRGVGMNALLDAVAVRDAARALPLVEPVLTQPKTTAVSFVGVLTMQVLAMAWGRAMLDAGSNPGRLKSEYFTVLKQSGGTVGRPWGEAVQSWVSNLKHWSARDLEHAADLVLAADLALKDTRVSSDEAIVSSLVLALCTPLAPGMAA